MKFIALDAGPLGLLTQRPGVTDADQCRAWLARKASTGVKVLVPEIADYEVRRELIRAGKANSVRLLDQFLASPEVDYLPDYNADHAQGGSIVGGFPEPRAEYRRS